MDLTAIIKSIQTNYFEILENYYGEFFSEYISSGYSPNQFVSRYIHRQTPILLLNGETNHTTKMLDFTKTITALWDANIHQLKSALQIDNSIGYFGTIEDNDTSYYENTIKQNALFFDIVAFNDPFYEKHKLDQHIRQYNGNIFLFYQAIISIFSIRRYILNSEDSMAIIIPTRAIVNAQDEQEIMERAYVSAQDAASKLFGINYESDNVYESMKVLKELSDDNISKIFRENYILTDLHEARHYEQYALSEEERADILEASRSLFGYVNQDFIRCIFNYSSISHILTTILHIHAMHTEAAKRFKMNPIYNVFEWYPNKYYYENIPGNDPSSNYKYVCAIQRNERLAQFVQMDMNALVKFRADREAEKFRQLFHLAMEQIISSPDEFDDIANMLFCNLKEVLNSSKIELEKQNKKEKATSVFGFSKAAGGVLVPVVSQVLGLVDLVKSVFDIKKAFSRKDDIISYLVNNSDNILNK